MKESVNTRLFAIILVLGIPMIGVYLTYYGATISDMIMMAIGVFMVLLFPIVITAGILRKKNISSRAR